MKIFTKEGIPGIFIKRINRFVALVKVDDEETWAHVPNTGRMKELLVYGSLVLLEEHQKNHRKTKYTLKLVKYRNQWVCIDAIMTNKIAYEYLNGKYLGILKPEVNFLSSRFDFALITDTKQFFIEVKSVNLVRNGIAYFPDAPTLRGRRHLIELQSCMEMGYGAIVIFIVQREDARTFMPYIEMDEKFTNELIQAYIKGMKIIVLRCKVDKVEITIEDEIDYILQP
ncbi:MAG: DNA/RNA nuclease SfsA [Eubacteriales bacterium]